MPTRVKPPSKTPNRRQAKADKPVEPSATEATATRRVALLIGNARVRDAEGKGYALDLPGVDQDLAGLSDVLGDQEYGGSRWSA